MLGYDINNFIIDLCVTLSVKLDQYFNTSCCAGTNVFIQNGNLVVSYL